MNMLRLLLAFALALFPLADAAAGTGTIQVKDAAGVTKTFFVVTDGSSNFYAAGVICDQSAAAACASVGTAGSPSTNALTVQAVTLGHGTAANAMRVELPTDGTGLVLANPGTAGNWGIGLTGSALPTSAQLTGFSDGTNTVAPKVGAVSNVASAAGMVQGLSVCQYNAAPPTITDTRYTTSQCDVNGNPIVRVINTNANGQTTMSASSPVTLASDQAVADPCTFRTKTNVPISFQTTTLTQQIGASGSNKIYICSMALIASAATVFSVVGGTGANCASNQLAILGTTSASNGLSLAANGGLTLGSGIGTVASTAASSEICLVQSGAGNLVGNITYVYAP